jgi:hypothetical protein
MTTNSNEINARLSEIQSIAAALPAGGDVDLLRIELRKLASWANQTLLYLGKTDDQPCRCCPGECDCKQS